MPQFLRRRTVAGALVALPFAASSAGFAQSGEWPSKPLRFVVPFPPGGSTDPVARILQARLMETTSWNIVVENRPGGTGVVGAAAVAKAAPDGHTWLVVFDNHILNPLFTPDLPYKDEELAHVSLIGRAPQGIAVHPSRPWKSFAEIVAAAKKDPGKISISVLAASQAQVLLHLLQKDNAFSINTIPYKGGGPAIQDALSGHTDMVISSLTAIMPHIQAGKLRTVAVTGAKRADVLPDVATLAEQGLTAAPSYSWWGVYAPAGTPRPIVERMNAELAKAARSPEVGKKFVDLFNMEVLATSPEEFAAYHRAEAERWGKVIRENNIKPE